MMRFGVVASIGGFAVLMALLSLSNAASNAAPARIPAAAIDTLFAKFVSAHDPGCAVLVIKDGKPVFRKGYGVADSRTLRKIGPETNFDVFSDFPAYGKAITIRQLLNHTSGLTDYEDIMAKQYSGISDDKIPQIRDAGVLELLKRETDTKFTPGSRWAYSNSGYVVLAMVVEKRSGMSFGDFLRQRVFMPLHMEGTVAYEKGKNEITRRAYGNTKTPDGWRETDQSSTSATLGDGGVYTSLDDLAKWDAALTAHTLLSAKEMEPALTAAVAPNGAPLQQADGSLAPLYGFGWFLDPYKGHRRYSHYGETVGFRNAIQRFPDDRLAVIVLSNRAEVDAPALAESVADLYFVKR